MTATVASLDLREAWAELLARRRALAPSLAPYGGLLEAWARQAPDVGALDWSTSRARACWAQGVPLTVAAPPSLVTASLEDLLGNAMELVAAISPWRGGALQLLAQAWDGGKVQPRALLPARSGIGDGTVEALTGLDSAAVVVLGYATLRPVLQAWVGDRKDDLEQADWSRGMCPLCGAAPGFTEVVEGGHRRLACHFCGATWRFAKLRCPLCGVEGTSDLHRLHAEGTDAGYAISACRACRGYLKELDRRERWNGGPAILEDWASPHLDIVGRREGYHKAVPALLDLA